MLSRYTVSLAGWLQPLFVVAIDVKYFQRRPPRIDLMASSSLKHPWIQPPEGKSPSPASLLRAKALEAIGTARAFPGHSLETQAHRGSAVIA